MNRQGPRLRNGVDLQLQSAFSDGNWQVAARLAEKRAKLTNDQYFEVVRICAESQLDDPTAKFGAASAVWQYAREGSVVKDVDAIDLLEWAARHTINEDDFAQTIGPLRVRAAKASPRDKNAVTRCLESCLLHWDLKSAQQIAALLDRSFPGEDDYLFWNIATTHLLSISSQAPPGGQKLYGTLAKRQIERLAQATEQADAPKTVRRVETEEEVILLYEIVAAHGSAEDFERLIASAVFSPIAQFRRGRKELLQRAVAKYGRDEKWAAVFELCKQCLFETDEEGEPTLLASDYATWKHLILAARHLKDTDHTVTEEVRGLLGRLISSKRMRPMYRRNILLARVAAAFDLGPDEEDVVNGQPSSVRLRELTYYLLDQSASAACFDDVKPFLDRLDVQGLKYLAHEHLPLLASQDPAGRRRLLCLKSQYLALTRRLKSPILSPSGPRCAVCESEAEAMCPTCLGRLSKSAVDLYKSMEGDKDEGKASAAGDILPEAAILAASCSLHRAFESQGVAPRMPPSARRHLLHGVLVLEDQLAKNPLHGQISLLLVQLHVFLGSAHRASEIWEALSVKRTIVDSLAPIFYDRLSTVAPTLLAGANDEWSEYLRELLRSHYEASLKLRMPRRLIDAFEAGSYGSVMKIPEYMQDLRASCTRVMSLTESKRAERLLGLSTIDVINDARCYEVDDSVTLTQVIDYGSFPAWSSSASRPLHIQLQGPALSSRRSHLSLLAETFHELLSYKPPSVYKVAAGETEETYVVEMMARLGNSFGKFLVGLEGECTPAETVYFEAVGLLSTLVALCVPADRAVSEELGGLMDALAAALEMLRGGVVVKDAAGVEQTVALLGSMHELAMLRDTAVAVRAAMGWMLGKGGLAREMVGRVKGLQGAAEGALREGQAVVGRVRGETAGRGFAADVRRWIEGEEEIVGIIEPGLVGEVVESWVTNAKGWGRVVW